MPQFHRGPLCPESSGRGLDTGPPSSSQAWGCLRAGLGSPPSFGGKGPMLAACPGPVCGVRDSREGRACLGSGPGSLAVGSTASDPHVVSCLLHLPHGSAKLANSFTRPSKRSTLPNCPTGVCTAGERIASCPAIGRLHRRRRSSPRPRLRVNISEHPERRPPALQPAAFCRALRRAFSHPTGRHPADRGRGRL